MFLLCVCLLLFACSVALLCYCASINVIIDCLVYVFGLAFCLLCLWLLLFVVYFVFLCFCVFDRLYIYVL